MSKDPDPDWDKIGEVARKAKSLRIAGTLTTEKFRELMSECEKACNGYPQFTECVLMWAPEDYVIS